MPKNALACVVVNSTVAIHLRSARYTRARENLILRERSENAFIRP